MATDLRRELEEHGWRIRYVPHNVIEDHNACYRVVYRGRIIYPPAADRLGIPLNEIWLSEKLRRYEENVLFHEFREIQYRYQGYGVEEAHLRARIDEALRFCNDSKWMRYFEEFPDYSVPLRCLKKLCSEIERGTKDIEALYNLLKTCIGD
ncbi:MAG: hypothetical protein DRO10_01065 [Thermoprotei archaeon]|nr:MAG: hypothetical protein DRO10_01065 [Thermoprotei archaeon]